ncbi:MAG TPA: hypothetical protein EYP93_01265 [Gammaproteobacteria bacterium]|nr:hypothetical protein [Gammaproteobacteria bacterium]
MSEKEEDVNVLREASKKWLESQLKEELPAGIKELLGEARFSQFGGPRPGGLLGGQQSGQQQPVATVGAVTLKLPTFWSNKAALWFAQAEAQFGLRSITADDTKFWYLVAALDQDSASQVEDVIKAPPDANKYQMLKDRLTAVFTLSEYEHARAILHGPELGDEAPGKLMNRMLGHLNGREPEFLFRCAFLDRMPEDIKQALIATDLTDCRKMGELADRLWKSRSEAATAMSLSRMAKPQAMKRTGLCWKHDKYGKKAHSCADPDNCEMRKVSSRKPPAAGN